MQKVDRVSLQLYSNHIDYGNSLEAPLGEGVDGVEVDPVEVGDELVGRHWTRGGMRTSSTNRQHIRIAEPIPHCPEDSQG